MQSQLPPYVWAATLQSQLPPLCVGACIASAVARQCNVTQATACEHPDPSISSGSLAWRRSPIRAHRVATLTLPALMRWPAPSLGFGLAGKYGASLLPYFPWSSETLGYQPSHASPQASRGGIAVFVGTPNGTPPKTRRLKAEPECSCGLTSPSFGLACARSGLRGSRRASFNAAFNFEQHSCCSK